MVVVEEVVVVVVEEEEEEEEEEAAAAGGFMIIRRCFVEGFPRKSNEQTVQVISNYRGTPRPAPLSQAPHHSGLGCLLQFSAPLLCPSFQL